MPKFVNLLCKPKGLQLAYKCLPQMDSCSCLQLAHKCPPGAVFAAHRQKSTRDAHSCHVAATRTNVSPGRTVCPPYTHKCLPWTDARAITSRECPGKILGKSIDFPFIILCDEFIQSSFVCFVNFLRQPLKKFLVTLSIQELENQTGS